MRPGGILLDTCAVIWLSTGQPVSSEAETKLQAAYESGLPVWISPFTAWEIGMLVSRGRLALSLSAEDWFEEAVTAPGISLASVSPPMLIRSSALPGSPPADPADRIMIATARELGATLMTRDRRILAYGDAGHVATMAC